MLKSSKIELEGATIHVSLDLNTESLDVKRLVHAHIDVKPSFYGSSSLRKVLIEIEIVPAWLPESEDE